MKRELQRIEPSSALKVGFFLGIVLGFFFGLLSGYFILAVSKTMSGVISPTDAESLSKLGPSGIWFFAFFYALFSSLICSLLGAMLAFVYNLTVKYFGGLEITISDNPASVKTQNRDEWQDHE